MRFEWKSMLVVKAAGLAAASLLSLGVQLSPALAHSQTSTSARAPQSAAPGQGDLPDSMPGHTHFLDHQNGFRGVQFGADFTQFKGLTVIHDWGKIKICRKDDETLELGPVSLVNVDYFFVNGKFFAVSLFANNENSPNLLSVTEAAFGQGTRPSTESAWFWSGRVASARYTILPEGRGSQVWIGNNDLAKDYDVEMGRIINEAAKSL